MGDEAGAVIVGAGWIGNALSSLLRCRVVARREFRGDEVDGKSVVVVASGRSAVSGRDGRAVALRSELDHLRQVLDRCGSAGARRVVVVGSSDVAGLTERVTGHSLQAPLTPYAEVKAALEDECILRAQAGLPVTCVRLAPVHGPGKSRSRALIRVARLPLVPLPGGGCQSIGFVLLDDALCAIQWLSENPAPPVVAVGGGPTPLRGLLAALGAAQGIHPRFVPVLAPAVALGRLAPLSLPDSLHWLLRLSLPREVVMEVPVPVTPLPEAAAMLVATC